MDVQDWEVGDRTFNRAVLKVQQQFLTHKVNTSQKFQKLEATIELAQGMMKKLVALKKQDTEDSLVNHFGWKSQFKESKGVTAHNEQRRPESLSHLKLRFLRCEEDSEAFDCQQHQDDSQGTYTMEPIFDEEPEESQFVIEEVSSLETSMQGIHEESEIISAFSTKKMVDSSPQVELRSPKFEGGEVFDSLQECEYLYAQPVYDEDAESVQDCLYDSEPVYDDDKESGEGQAQECWPEQDLILAVLGGDSPSSPNPSPSEICTTGRSQQLGEIPNLQQGNGNDSTKLGTIPSQLGGRMNTCLFPYWPEFENQNMCKQVYLSTLTKEGSAESLVNKPSKVLAFGDKAKIVGSYKVEEKQGTTEGVPLLIPTTRDIAEASLSKRIIQDFPTVDISYSLSKDPSNVLCIFDPGGQVQNDHPTGVINMFTELIKTKVKLDEVEINSFGGHHGQLEDSHLKFLTLDKDHSQWKRKAFIVQISKSAGIHSQDIQKENDKIGQVVIEINEVNEEYLDSVKAGIMAISYRLQLDRQGSLEKAMRFEEHDASRERVLLTIFDPGGNTHVSMKLNLLGKRLKFYILSSLQTCSKIYLIQEKEDWKCKIHHEDMVEF